MYIYKSIPIENLFYMISYVLELPFCSILNGNKSNNKQSLEELYIYLFKHLLTINMKCFEIIHQLYQE